MLRLVARFLKRHLIAITLILVVGIASSLFIVLYSDYQAKVTKDVVAASDARLAELNTIISKVLAEKAAKAAAELKAQQEAAAQAAAEQAKTASVNTAITLDSSACNVSVANNDPNKIDVLVNKKHCIQPLSFAPTDLVAIGSTGFVLSAKAVPSLEAMLSAAAAAGQPLSVTSSYRSYSTQIATYNYWVSVSGQSGADTYSARPGYSEHQTGFAVDVGGSGASLSDFAQTSQYAWLQANASEYGFVQRYIKGYEGITGYSAEEWHYRYVGIEVAKDMKARGIYTLEQYWDIPGGDY